MPNFTAIGDLPDGAAGAPEWAIALMAGLKENMELLTASRGEKGGVSAAVTRGSVTVAALGVQTMEVVSARGGAVPTQAEFDKLVNDVQALANDLYYTRQAFDRLLGNLRGES